MSKKKHIYTWHHKLKASFMLVALAWLTISAQFMVMNAIGMDGQVQHQSSIPLTTGEEDNSIPVNTEEKIGSNGSMVEEYLNEHSSLRFFYTALIVFRQIHDARLYVAYHGELLVPPPNYCI